MEVGFIADVHLGKLAKNLRLLGFDTAYKNNYTNSELIKIAVNEERILLSRNVAFSKNLSLQSYIIVSEDHLEQLRTVVYHFNLKEQIKPFTRCSVCNGKIHPINKSEIIESLQERTIEFYDEFWQ
jgi:uncharacterized protein with PIN domain